MLKSLDLFSGVGGITHALRGLARPVAYCEKDPACQRVLRKLMKAGKVPTAPLHDDVAKLTAANVGKVDAIVAGFPCIGFSACGLKLGLDNPGSKLFFHVVRLAKALRPPFLFLENVDAILGNDDIRKVVRSVRGMGYDMWWVVMPAYALGSPQIRRRWFCLAVLRGTGHPTSLTTGEAYPPFKWAAEPVPRMILEASTEIRDRMRMLGNTVVPDCVCAAFLSLWTGCKTPVRELLASSARPGRRFPLTPPAPAGPLLDSHSSHFACVTGSEKTPWQRIAAPPGMAELPAPKFVLDPAAYKAPKGYVPRDTSGRVTKPVRRSCWATPRVSNGLHGMHVLTVRGKNDLGSQLRYERGTPDALRPGYTNPEFVEWMMGYPRGWTTTS